MSDDQAIFDVLRDLSYSKEASQKTVSKLAASYGIDIKKLMEEAKKAESMGKEEKAKYIHELKESLPPDQRANLDKAVGMLKAFLSH